MDRPVIHRIEADTVYSDPDNPWVRLHFDRVRFPNGREGRYNRLEISGGRRGVVVVPMKGDLIGLVGQFRYPVGRFMWEFPRGFGETDDPLADARRELAEEMGESAHSTVDLGTVTPDSGLIETEVCIVGAVCGSGDPASERCLDEIAGIRWLPLADLLEEIRTGSITDAYTLCGVLRAQCCGFFARAEG